jgi:hypothetical protein
MFIGFLSVFALSTAFVGQLPPQPPPALLTPGAGISTYEVDVNLLVCEFVGQHDECYMERLDVSFIATGRILLYYYCRRFPWGYVPYHVQVRYERSPTGRFLAEIKATPIRGRDTVTLRGWGNDPNTALRAAHSGAFITPLTGAP